MSRREFVCDKEESASPYPDLDDSEQPSVHQGRALGIYLTQRQAKEYPQQIVGHANVEMTEVYGKGHDEQTFTDATPAINPLDRASIEALKPSKTVA